MLGFAIFFVIYLSIGIISQGGLTPSSDIVSVSNSTVASTNSSLPIQEMGFPQGASDMIATAMLGHILLANLGLGGAWIAVIAERSYIKRQDERYDRLSHSVILLNVVLFSTGSTFAFAGVMFMISLFPSVISTLFHIYFWPLVFEALTFLIEIFFIYTYYFLWNKVSRRWHQVLGYGYAITVVLQTFLIDMLAGGMLTPGGTSIQFGSSGTLTMSFADAMAWWFNPSLVILTAHRLAASLSYVGFIIAMLAMLHYKDQRGSDTQKYWDWVGSYGMWWGVGGLIAQVPLGMVYAAIIQFNAPDAFNMMMHGPRAWEMLLMVGLFSILMLVLLVYFVDRREPILSKQENTYLHRLFQICLVIALVCAFFLVQPAWFGTDFITQTGSSTLVNPNSIINPLGKMTFKYIALLTFLVIGLILLIIDTRLLRDDREGEWGHLSKTSRIAGFLAGLLAMWIILTMGFTRESAREPWTIMDVFPVEGMTINPTPVAVGDIISVWIGITVFMFILLYAVSRRSSYNPETAE